MPIVVHPAIQYTQFDHSFKFFMALTEPNITQASPVHTTSEGEAKAKYPATL